MNEMMNPKEILQIAVQIEENGKKLYASLENKASNKKIKTVWEYLKNQEEKHGKVFQGMLNGVSNYVVADFNQQEYNAYIRFLAKEYVFTQNLIEEKTSQGFSSDLAAIEFAITIEKDSILIYSALKEYVLTEKQKTIEKIIHEEQKHLADLLLLKGEVRK